MCRLRVVALERHLQQAGFEDRVVLDGFDWSAPIQVDRRQVQALFSLDFLRQHEHVFFGVGKTMLAQCLGTAAVRSGFDVLFSRADVLLKELAQARVDHTFRKTFRRFLAPDLLIVDDFAD